jgi:hypothetical protein
MEPEDAQPFIMALIAFIAVVPYFLWGALTIWSGQ